MQRFAFTKEIGKGAFGTVWKGFDRKTKKDVVIKIIKQDYPDMTEVMCLQKLVHPNIITMYQATMENNTLCLVLEWMESDLSNIIKNKGKRFSEEEVRNISFQLFKALTRMHKEGYCHRDLKPENLLMTGDVIKIADFGLAINIPEEPVRPLHSYLVTGPYRAPELLLESMDCDFAIDIWAVGAIMLQLFTCHAFFNGYNAVTQLYKICSVIGSPNNNTWPEGLALASSLNYSFPKRFSSVDCTKRFSKLLRRVSAEAIDLIRRLLSWDPKKRPKAIEAMQHPFFCQSYDINRSIPPPPLPKKLLLPRYPATVTYNSEACQYSAMQKSPDNAGGFSDLSIDSVSYDCSSVGQFHLDKPFRGKGTSQIKEMVVAEVKQQVTFDYDNQEDGNVRPTTSTVTTGEFFSEYSIRKRNGYLRSCQIPVSLPFSNLPSNPRVRDDKVNNRKGVGD